MQNIVKTICVAALIMAVATLTESTDFVETLILFMVSMSAIMIIAVSIAIPVSYIVIGWKENFKSTTFAYATVGSNALAHVCCGLIVHFCGASVNDLPLMQLYHFNAFMVLVGLLLVIRNEFNELRG